MKKLFKILLVTLASILALIVVFLLSIYFINIICKNIEQDKIETYGQLVPVDGKNMNVLIQGDGEETVVLLPGYGTASPVIDFMPLVNELSPYYKVVVIEPFGYGLSDDTEKERSIDNIMDEIHDALQQLNIDKYTIMGHSIAGIYALPYVKQYEDEVVAFVGIDSSVPTQDDNEELPVKLYQQLNNSGFFRLLMKLNPDMVLTPNADTKTKEQVKMLTLKNFMNASQVSETENMISNFKSTEHLNFPKTLPVIFYLAEQSVEESSTWKPKHEELISHSDHGELLILEGEHYLHHTKSKEIVERFRNFMTTIQEN